MTQFGTSLRFVQLSAVVEMLAGIASTGRLRLVSGELTAEIVLRRGQIVSASLGEQHGLAALDSILLGMLDGEVSFTDDPVAEDDEALFPPTEQHERMKTLEAERARIKALVPSLQVVPRLVEGSDSPVVVGAAALRIIPQLAFGHTLREIARRRGLGRTLRDIAALVESGVVTLEAPAAVTVTTDNCAT